MTTTDTTPSRNGQMHPTRSERFKFIDSAEFLTKNYEQLFLISHALVGNQPRVIAGPSKAMKTSLVVDRAVSLATGTPSLACSRFRIRSA
jgi:hypothetical protein